MADFEVVCPIRNGGENFAATLSSLRDQGGTGGALLISDNFSTDGQPWRSKLEALKGWTIRVIQPPAELGRVEHWNWACEQSDAPCVKPMMSGDLLTTGAIANLQNALNQNPDAAFVFGQTHLREADKQSLIGPPHGGGPMEWDTFLTLSLAHCNFTGTLSAIAFRGKNLRAALPFDPRWPWTADWRLLAACARNAPCFYLPEPVCVLDRTQGRYSSRASTIWPSLREEWIFLTELARERFPDKCCPLLGSRINQLALAGAAKYGRATLPKWFRKPLGACYRVVNRLAKR